MNIKERLKYNFITTRGAIRLFRKTPLQSLGQLIPIGMICTSVISFVVALLIYIASVGFSDQFTLGTVGIVNSGITSRILLLLLLAEWIVLIILYLKTETKVKRVTLSVCLTIIMLCMVAYFSLAASQGEIYIPESAQIIIIAILFIFKGIQPSVIMGALRITAFIVFIAIALFIILMFLSKHKEMMGKTIKALLFSYIFVPLLLLLIENIIPLFTGMILVVIFGGGLLFMGKGLNSGDGEVSTSRGSDKNIPNEKSQVKSNKVEKYQEIKKYSLNPPFWRDEGGCGVNIPMSDCIYVKDAWGDKKYVCTVSAFEKGDVVIINKNVRVMEIAGCRTPER